MTLETFLIKAALADATFRQLVGGVRIYDRELALVKDPVLPCVNMQTAGGDLVTKLADARQVNVRVWCWTEDGYSSAQALYDAFFAVMHNQRKTYLTAFGVCWETMRPTNLYDATADWYAKIATWQANVFNL